MAYKLEHEEILLAVAFAVMGFVLTMREWLLWLNGLNPIEGLFVYYAIMYGAIFVLSKLGLVVMGIKITTWAQTLGIVLLVFAFFLIMGWSSSYTQYITTGSFNGVSPVYLQCEDGAVFYIWQQLLPGAGVDVLRMFTYVLSPFAIALAGGYLADKKVTLGV